MTRVLGPDLDHGRIVAQRRGRLRELRLHILAGYWPGRAWRPKVRVEGAEHLDAALARGSGAVLWISDFVYSTLVTKIALRDAGYRVAHLSRPTHGFSQSAFGVAVLNPIWTRVEDRYLDERVTIRSGDGGAALGRLRTRLAENGIVSITVGNDARTTVEAPFGGARLRVATGPAHLALSSGAPLLPVFTVHRNDGVHLVRIGEPLTTGSAVLGDPHRDIVVEYAARLLPDVRAYPDQWSGWGYMVLAD